MDHREQGGRIARRDWLKVVSGALVAALPSRGLHAQGVPYRVGVGHATDPYGATIAAISESGEWPAASIAGRTVVIKVNLVLSQPSERGGTTHPEVTRALVDLALAAGAVHVRIVESASLGLGFVHCGYEFFRTYDPDGRVSLYDLSLAETTFIRVPNGSAYGSLYMPNVVLDPNIVFISAAKLKTHVETGATLSLKNLFGLPPVAPYLRSRRGGVPLPVPAARPQREPGDYRHRADTSDRIRRRRCEHRHGR